MRRDRFAISWSELADWWEIRRNRLLVDDAPSFAELAALWRVEPGGRALDDPGGLDWLLVITTYNRPQACARLIRSLGRAVAALGDVRAHLLVLDDASTTDGTGLRAALAEAFGPRHTLLRARRNLGKPGFWMTYQMAFFAAERLRPAHALFLQDDLEIEDSLLREAHSIWRSIDDPRKQVLYLFNSPDDEPGGRWVKFDRVEFPGRRYRLTQWFDLSAFLVGASFFELLGYRVFPIHPNRWRRRPAISSGVGAQLTRRLWRRGNIYQTTSSLVLHGSEPSVMNPEARRLRALDNRRR